MLTVLCIVLVVAILVLTLGLLGFCRWLWRAMERKDRANLELLDRAMHLADRPWNNAPALDDKIAELERAALRREKELEARAAQWDGYVEDPQSGASYRNAVTDIEELFAAEAISGFDHTPIIVDTADLEPPL